MSTGHTGMDKEQKSWERDVVFHRCIPSPIGWDVACPVCGSRVDVEMRESDHGSFYSSDDFGDPFAACPDCGAVIEPAEMRVSHPHAHSSSTNTERLNDRQRAGGPVMGNTAVAVLHYDFSSEIKNADARMALAMLEMPGIRKPLDFGFGQIIAWDHANGYQVCVVHGNTGWRIGFERTAPDAVLEAVASALREHGYVVKKKKTDTARVSSTPTGADQ